MSKPGLKANLSFKFSLNVTSADIDGTTPTLAEFKDLTGVTRQVVQRIFGTGRLFNRGKCLAREGYLSGFPMTVKVSEGTAVIEGKCWASQKKKTNYDVLLVLALASPDVDSECSIIHSKCSCPAGLEKCVHLSALMQFIVARASFWTYLEEEGHSKETSLLSPTSQPCKWSIPPKRSVDPNDPVEDIAFQKVSSQEAFQPLKPAKKPKPEESACVEDLEKIHRYMVSEAHQSVDTMVMLRYLPGGTLTFDSEDMSNVEPSFSLRHDDLRPSPIKYPLSLAQAVKLINNDALPPSASQIEKWSSAIANALTAADREEICAATSSQATSERWYTERVCRLTASKFYVVCKRREKNMFSLVRSLLYSAPPVATGPLKFGRDNEPVAVDLYCKFMSSKSSPVQISETGLHVHPSIGFLAASPDRCVHDLSTQPPEGLLEVKCMPSIDGAVEENAGKKGFCLVRDKNTGRVHLSASHAHYYQIQGQLACTGRSWCDFVVMSRTKNIFVERIFFDTCFWAGILPRLKRFFKQFFVRELVYPASPCQYPTSSQFGECSTSNEVSMGYTIIHVCNISQNAHFFLLCKPWRFSRFTFFM